jgi:hypothetical protein
MLNAYALAGQQRTPRALANHVSGGSGWQLDDDHPRTLFCHCTGGSDTTVDVQRTVVSNGNPHGNGAFSGPRTSYGIERTGISSNLQHVETIGCCAFRHLAQGPCFHAIQSCHDQGPGVFMDVVHRFTHVVPLT